jgi:hypothetical protein
MDAPTLPPGLTKPDFRNEKFRYLWRAQYDDRRGGPWVYQLDELGLSRSVAGLDWARVVRIELVPQWEGLPTIELRVDPGNAEKAIKYWNCDLEDLPDARPLVREVVGIQKNVACRKCGEVTATKTLVFHQAYDNRVIVTANPEV